MNRDATPILTFKIGTQRYALMVDDVVEVAAMVALVSVPDAPAGILGVANRHGAILPILDLRRVFGFPAPRIDLTSIFIVAAHGSQQIGLVVDEVSHVDYVDVMLMQPGGGRFVQGIVSHHGELVQILALPTLFAAYLPDALPVDAEWVDNDASGK